LPYTQEKIRHWLSWLAQAMVRHEQTVFYLERMQPDWLPQQKGWWQQISSTSVFGLLFGLVFLVFMPVGGLSIGLLFGLFFGLFGWVLVVQMENSIQPVETLHWSWKEAHNGLVDVLANGLQLGLSIGLFGGLLGGLAGLLFGGPFLFYGLFAGLVGGLFGGLLGWLGVGLFGGLYVGLLFGLIKGGKACIQHGVLRVLLWRYDYAPLRYVRFLEHAKDLLFLRRVGGGYIFVHRMLMEHLAGLEGATRKQQTAANGEAERVA
jgi:hypothetical protein